MEIKTLEILHTLLYIIGNWTILFWVRVWIVSASCVLHLVSTLQLFFFFLKRVSVALCYTNGSRALFTGLTNLFFQQLFIENESYDTIHTFKNHFITVLSVFNKISGIKTHHKCVPRIIQVAELKSFEKFHDFEIVINFLIEVY